MNALILFVKYPEPGNVKTRLGKTIGMDRAADVYREIAQSAFRISAAIAGEFTTIYVWFDPGADLTAIQSWVGDKRFVYAEQRGDSLGDRMRHAFQEAFGHGATKVVILGTDVPEINLSIVDQAFDALERHEVVLGPSTDGGYYLLGMRAPGHDLFDGIPWSTPDVFPATLRLLEKHHATVAFVPQLSDIDTLEDYIRFRARHAGTKDKSGN